MFLFLALVIIPFGVAAREHCPPGRGGRIGFVDTIGHKLRAARQNWSAKVVRVRKAAAQARRNFILNEGYEKVGWLGATVFSAGVAGAFILDPGFAVGVPVGA